MSKASPKTLEQRLIDIGFRDTPFRKQIINEVKEWLQQKHKEWTEKIQYEELYVHEIIPLLLEKLEAQKEVTRKCS